MFHSFRHGFKDALRAAGVSEDVNDALTGHAGGNSIARGYGAKDMVRRFGLRTLADAVSKARYPGLDLSDVDRLAQAYGKRVIHLALRWVLDRAPNTIALWGARHPAQLDPVRDVLGWTIDAGSMQEIDRIVAENVRTPLGPEFMAPPEDAAA